MVLDITPEDLGRMTISLSVQGDSATVRILTETPEAARLLLEAERQLANELARFGMSLAGHEASADRHGGGPQGWAGRGAGPAGADMPDAAIPVPANARLVNLIA
jgi:flagellar hook-length control protein FliK